MNLFILKVNLELVEEFAMYIFGISVALFWVAVLLEDNGIVYSLQSTYSAIDAIESISLGQIDFEALYELYAKILIGGMIGSLAICLLAMVVDWILFIYITIKYDI